MNIIKSTPALAFLCFTPPLSLSLSLSEYCALFLFH